MDPVIINALYLAALYREQQASNLYVPAEARKKLLAEAAAFRRTKAALESACVKPA